MVWRVSRQLDGALAGRVLTRSDFRVPRFATTNLAGRTVHEATSRGKHLLIRVGGGVTVHTHLRMEGSWRIWPASRYPPRDHRVRLVLANEAWQAVGYLLGVVEVLPTAREGRVLGHLGPDLLGPDWDAAEAAACAPRRTGPPARRCWIRRTWPASGTCTRPRSSSCAASVRGSRSARSTTSRRSSSWRGACWRQIRSTPRR